MSDYLDMKAFQRDGVVTEPDFNRLSAALCKALEGFRVATIRKGLAFAPTTHDVYIEKAKEEYEAQYLPTPDPEMAFELNAVSVTVEAKFMLSFFPEFAREYTFQGVLDYIALESSPGGYCILPPNQFRSLILAGHQIETECKARYKACNLARDLTGRVEVETTWLLPPTLLANDTDELTLQITFSMMLD